MSYGQARACDEQRERDHDNDPPFTAYEFKRLVAAAKEMDEILKVANVEMRKLIVKYPLRPTHWLIGVAMKRAREIRKNA